MPSSSSLLSRRRLITLAVSGVLAGRLPFAAHAQEVNRAEHDNLISPPRPVPDLPVRCADGRTTRLQTLLKGHTTALQFIFTECHTVCPIQGVIFQRVQELLPSSPAKRLQLLSLSIDPEADRPEMLAQWLQRYRARKAWLAAAPEADGLPTLRRFFQDESAVARHTTQVHLIDREGRWIWKTYNLPSAETVATLLTRI